MIKIDCCFCAGSVWSKVVLFINLTILELWLVFNLKQLFYLICLSRLRVVVIINHGLSSCFQFISINQSLLYHISSHQALILPVYARKLT